MKIWGTVAGRDVFDLGDGSYLWVAGMQIDGDGAGGNSEGDPDWQSTTSLKNIDGSYLNARTQAFFVVPPEILYGIPGAILGCKGRVTNLSNEMTADATPGDDGPSEKLGEGSIHLAQLLNDPSNPRTGGNPLGIFAYRIWPGIPAPGYHLQSA
jgi:hypothetical protein